MDDVPLWLMIGLPGSGKSTWAHQFVAGPVPVLWVSTDAIRAQRYGHAAVQGNWGEVWAEVQHQFHQGVTQTRQGRLGGVLYDATNTRRRARKDVIKAARRIGFGRILAVWLDVPVECCLSRNRQRSRQVPEAVIQTMARQLAGAPPHCSEGLDAVFRLGTGARETLRSP